MPNDSKLTDDEQAVFDFLGTLSIFRQPQPAFRQLSLALHMPQERAMSALKSLQRRGMAMQFLPRTFGRRPS